MVDRHHARPLKVLHCLGRMDFGGVETWLMHVLRRIDPSQVQTEIIVHSDAPGSYDAELRDLAVKVHPLPFTGKPSKYRQSFVELTRGEILPDIIHSHVYAYSGWILASAAQAGVRGRISHAHTDRRNYVMEHRWSRRIYRWYMRRLLLKHATLGLACSKSAAEDLYGENWRQSGRWHVLPYGLDLSPFAEACESTSLRRELNLRDKAFVVGHVGRMTHAKNHPFLIKVFKAVVERIAEAQLVLVGDGPEVDNVRKLVQEQELTGRVLFLGNRWDVARLMRAFDVFIFPSRFEGFGIVVVEAQAAGLPCVISDVVPPEVDIVPDATCRLPLTVSPSIWAEKILRRRDWKTARRQLRMLRTVQESPYNIDVCIESLLKHYSHALEH